LSPQEINDKISFLTVVSRQCKQHQLKKPSSIEFDIPIHKRFAINLLLGVGQKGPSPGSDRVKPYILANLGLISTIFELRKDVK